ncbi:MAG: hypothetical protein AB8G86_16815 [Saprospiraceae bacterium]
MAKSKNRKKKKKVNQAVKIKPANYIRKYARKLPIHECLIRDNWEAAKFSPVIVSRKKANGDIIIANYIVDMQCLGVKDTFFRFDLSPMRYREIVEEMGRVMDVNFIPIETNLVHNIIYGAVEFAEDCGFEPHKDFTTTTEYLLDHVESIDYIEIDFGGEDGKPFFFAGPYDDSKKIMDTLNKTVGEGNFHYTIEIARPDDYEIDYEIDYDENNSLMSKKEILETFLPNDKVKQKVSNFELDNYQAAFIPQIICAGFILEEIEGQVHLLEAAYTQNQDFLVNVLEKLANSYATSQGLKITEIEEDVMNELDNLVIFLTEKIIEFEGTDFLFEASYIPIPREVSKDKLDQMTVEELDAHQAHREFYMTQNEKYHHRINEFAYYYISVNHKETDFTEEAVQQSVIEQFIAYAKEDRALDEETEQDYRTNCQAVIADLFLTK